MAPYRSTFSLRRLWLILLLGLVAMFGVLLYYGGQIYQQAPPIPQAFVGPTRPTLHSRDDIHRGQSVWQSMGGMQQGSVWGHGSYLAPDWSAFRTPRAAPQSDRTQPPVQPHPVSD